MIDRYLLLISFCSIFQITAQDNIAQIPDSLKGKDFDYLFDRIEHPNVNDTERNVYMGSIVLKAKYEENWEELSNSYKNYVHYAPEKLKLKYADSMVLAARRSKNNKVIGSAYLSKGIAYYGQKRLREAMDLYLIADRYIENTNDQYLIYKTKYNIGLVKYYLGYYEEAIKVFLECINYFKGSDVRGYLNSLHSLGLCYNMVGNHGLCTATNETGIAEGIKLDNLKMSPYFIHSEGVNQYMIHNYTIAIKKLQSSLPAIRQNKDFANETVGYFYIGKCFWDMGNLDKAVPYLKKVDKSFMEHNYIRPDLRESYELIISYYKKKNMLPAQLHYIEKLIKADKQLHLTYSYLQGKIRKEYDTKELIAEKKKIELSLSRRKYNDEIFLSVISAMSMFSAYWIVRYFRSRKESRRRYEELVRKIESSRKIKSTEGDEVNFAMSKDAELGMLQNLQKFEKGKKFLEKDLSVAKLAAHFNTNTKYLSQIIYKYRNKKFNGYINSLKVERIADRIRSDKFLRNYTHTALAEEAGFSSTRRFVNAFVLNTGITPRYFIEELQKDDV